jgi:hypothetical protein
MVLTELAVLEQPVLAEAVASNQAATLAEPAAQVGHQTATAGEFTIPAEVVARVEQAAAAGPEPLAPVLQSQPMTVLAAAAIEGQPLQFERLQAEPVQQSDPAPERVRSTYTTAASSVPDPLHHASVDAVFAPRFEHVLREPSSMQPGTLLNGRYRVVGALERGGVGQLLDAIDTASSSESRVTLKMIEIDWHEEPRAFDTLQAIVRHVRRLRHPNILSILDICRDDGHAIVVTEPLRGRWLSGLLREVRGRGLGFAVSWNIISGIANGLAYAHQHGAVHAELNPHMIFLTEEGTVKIAGFGLAQAIPMSMEPLAALDGLTLRTYADMYSATNWVHGSTPQGVDDLYPLGIIAYELLTGVHPFNRLSPAAAAAQQMRPSPIPGLDRRIRKVIERCLSFARQERPVNGANFLARIEPSEQLLELMIERFKRPTENPG